MKSYLSLVSISILVLLLPTKIYSKDYSNIDSIYYNQKYLELDTLVNVDFKNNIMEMAKYFEFKAYQFSKAIECQKHLIKIANKVKDYPLLIHSYSALGRLQVEIARYDLSYNYAIKALKLSDKYNYSYYVAEIYNTLGKVSYYCADYDSAKDYYKKILKLPSNELNDYNKALAINNSTVFEKDIDKIKAMMDKAIKLCPGDKFKNIKCTFLLNLCVSYINHDDLIKAKYYLDLVKDSNKSIENQLSYYRNLGIINLESKDYKSAKINLEKAYEYSLMGEFELKRAKVLSILNWVYASLEEYKNAYGALAVYNELENKLPKNKILLKLFNTQKEASISYEKQKQKSYILIIIFSVIILAFISYAMYTNKIQKLKEKAMKLENESIKKEKEEQEAKLKYEIKEQNIKRQNDILAIKRLKQYQDEVLIDNIISKLKELNNKLGIKNLGSNIYSIIRELETSKDKSHWEEIETFLLETNTDFYENLLQDFPDLTVNERRLCSFLHMNMTSKEISLVTRKSVNSITTARSRLRAKLNINGDDLSIVSFLDKYANKSKN